MRKKRSRSTGEHADVRNALVKKLRATGPYFNPRLKLIASVLEIYPADAENVYTAGKGIAVALIHEAMEIMKLVGDLAPEAGSQEASQLPQA